jgi:hypothetical protein
MKGILMHTKSTNAGQINSFSLSVHSMWDWLVEASQAFVKKGFVIR